MIRAHHKMVMQHDTLRHGLHGRHGTHVDDEPLLLLHLLTVGAGLPRAVGDASAAAGTGDQVMALNHTASLGTTCSPWPAQSER